MMIAASICISFANFVIWNICVKYVSSSISNIVRLALCFKQFLLIFILLLLLLLINFLFQFD